eukprot:s487_g12.t1
MACITFPQLLLADVPYRIHGKVRRLPQDWSKSLQDVATSGLQHIGQRIAEAEIPYKALWPCGTLCFFAYLFWAIRVANILHGYHLLYEELSSPLVAAAVAYWLLMPLVMVTLGFMSTPEGGAPVIAYCVWFGFWACHMAAAFTSGKLTAKGAMMTRCSKALGKGEKLFYATLEQLRYGDRVTDQWVHSWQDLRFGNLVVPVIEAYGFSGVALVLFVTTAYLPQLLVSPSFMAPVLCLTFLAITWVWTQLGGLFGLVLLAGLFALLEWSGGAEMWWEGFVTGFALANDKWLLLWLGLEAFTKVVMTKVVFENGPQLWLQSAFLAMTWGAPHGAVPQAAASARNSAVSSRSFSDAGPSGLSSMATGAAALCLMARRSCRKAVAKRHRTGTLKGVAGRDVDTPHWSQRPMEDATGGLRLEQLDWPNVHGLSCGASGVLFLYELVRFCLGQPPSDLECYAAALIYAVIYASRFDGIRTLAPHFRVTFYATTGIAGNMA